MTENTPNNSPEAVKGAGRITDIGALFSRSLNFYRDHFIPLLKILLFFILAALPIWVVVGARWAAAQFGGYTEYGLDPVNAVFFIVGAAAFLFSVYVSISAKATLLSYFKEPEKISQVRELFHKCRKEYFWPLLLINVLVAVFVFLWSLLLIIPGIIFAVYYAFSGWVLIYEGHKGRSALKRSKELVKGYWWAVVGRYIVLYLALFLVTIVLDILAGIGGEAVGVFTETVKQLISFLFAPLLYAYSYFIYRDLLKIKGAEARS